MLLNDPQAVGSISMAAAEHAADYPLAVGLCGRHEKRFCRRPALVYLGSVVETNHSALKYHAEVCSRHLNPAASHRFVFTCKCGVEVTSTVQNVGHKTRPSSNVSEHEVRRLA